MRPARGRRLLEHLRRNDRFLTARMLAAVGAYLAIAASYLQGRVSNDGVIYFDFMRRLVGEDVQAYAYQFGVVFWNLPFYVLSRLLRLANDDDWIEHVQIGALSVAIASTAAVVAIFYVVWLLLRELGLPGGPGAILLTVLGSPLFYYAIFQPGYKHAFDTLLVCVLALLLVRVAQGQPTTAVALGIGAVMALSISVRYANVVLLLGVVYVLLRRASPWYAYAATTTAVVGATAILALPILLGVPYGLPPEPEGAGARPGAAASHDGPAALARPSFRLAAASAGRGVDDVGSFDVDLLAPAKMLFTVKRGLFVWTPLTLFGVVGFALFAVRERRHRTALVGIAASLVALLLVHAVWGAYWAGGFSFSQRFLTGFFPMLAIGIAELLRRTRLLIVPALVVCIAWSWFLALHHFYGYDYVSDRDGAARIVELYRTGEETRTRFWDRRVSGPIGRHWDAYFEWAGLSARAGDRRS